MRVWLDEKEKIHARLSAGCFTIHEDGAVSWHTPYEPLRRYAGKADAEIILLAFLEERIRTFAQSHGELLDAVLLAGDRIAILVKKTDASRLMVLDLDATRILGDIALVVDAPRLDCFRSQEEWSKSAMFQGSSGRGLRLHRTAEGLTVAANESGHVATVAIDFNRLERVFRVPGAPENTVYAAKVANGVLIGMLWNHRHSELYLVDDASQLLAKWPPEGEVRWGMPTPVVMGNRVIVYSDEGPHAGSLHLLELSTLKEIAYLELAAPPYDMHGDPNTGYFLAALERGVVIGCLNENGFAGPSFWHVNEVMKQAGVRGFARPNHATLDGRGNRLWLEKEVSFFGMDQGIPIVEYTGTHEIVAWEGTSERRVLVAPTPVPETSGKARLWAIFDAPRHSRLDYRHGMLLFQTDEGITRMKIAGGPETIVVRETSNVEILHQLTNGIWYVVRDKNDSECFHAYWLSAEHEAKNQSPHLISTFAREGIASISAFAETNDVWWIEYTSKSEDVGENGMERGAVMRQVQTVDERFRLCRWSGEAMKLDAWEIERPIDAIAVDQGVAYVITRGRHVDPEGYDKRHLWRVVLDGSLERISKRDLGVVKSFVVGHGEAYWIDPPGLSNQGHFPACLKRLNLSTGEMETVAEAIFGDLGCLTLADDTLWWLESGGMSVDLYGRGLSEKCASVCRLSLRT